MLAVFGRVSGSFRARSFRYWNRGFPGCQIGVQCLHFLSVLVDHVVQFLDAPNLGLIDVLGLKGGIFRVESLELGTEILHFLDG